MRNIIKRFNMVEVVLVLVVLLGLLFVNSASDGAAGGVILAAASLWSYTSRANPNLLAQKMYLQQWRDHPFGRWVAPEYVKLRGTDTSLPVQPLPGEAKHVGAPIEVFEDFVKYGKTDLSIPVRVRLTGDPVHGDSPLKGTGERISVAWRNVKINYTRKAVTPPTGTSLQIIKQYADKIAFDAADQLRIWLNDYHPGNFILTMCAGASADLINPSSLGGRAVGIVSHPNFYVAGSGKVSYSGGRPGTAGYEGAVESALNGLSGAAAEDKMSLALVRNLRAEAVRLKIQPIGLKAGLRRYIMWIKDSQWNQLQTDADFKDFYKRLPTELNTTAWATGAVCDYDGVLIYVDQDLFCAHTNTSSSGVVTSTKVWYGPLPSAARKARGYTYNNWINNLDTGNLAVGFLVGQSAMSVGVAVPQDQSGKFGPKITFTDEIDDHGFIQEIGMSMVQSVVRNDVYDVDGQIAGLSAGDFFENTSSLAFATYSPYALGWS